jgi:hypothetical protein
MLTHTGQRFTTNALVYARLRVVGYEETPGPSFGDVLVTPCDAQGQVIDRDTVHWMREIELVDPKQTKKEVEELRSKS